MPWTSSSACFSSWRASFRRPLPPSASRNFVISLATWVRARPLSRTILRKKKSIDWMAVVPSYRESIFESRMYCPFGADALHDGQQQVVDPLRQLQRLLVALAGPDLVLERRRVQVHRAQALGVGLLQHQAAADVRVGGDRHARGRLVQHLGEVGALHALLGVLQR